MAHEVRGKRVCIIGGGAAGIISAKIFRERGFKVLIYEAETAHGGIWRYQEHPEQAAGIAPCYKSLRTNASREMMELSDYEFRAPTLFPRHEAVLEYLDNYARHFRIIGGSEEIIQYERTVTKAVKDPATGKWRVTTMSTVHADAEGPIPLNSDDEDTGSGFLYTASCNSLNSSFCSLSSLQNARDRISSPRLGAEQSVTPTPSKRSPLGQDRAPDSSPSPPLVNTVPYYKSARPSLSRASSVGLPTTGLPKVPEVLIIGDSSSEDEQQDSRHSSITGASDPFGERTEEFDFLVVATGAYRVPQVPQIPGLEEFQGTVLHSVEYRRPQPLFVRKRVLVVGLGSSAIDVALEAKNFAKEVQISSLRGTWLVPRFIGNQPYDHTNTRAWVMVPNFIREIAFRHYAMYLPKGHANESLPITGRSRVTPDAGLAVSALAGSVAVVGPVQRFSANAAHFADGSHFRCDVVVLCSGFQRAYDYLDESVLARELRNYPPLYRHVFLPEVEGIAFVGACKVTGAVFPIIELQARWVSHVFAGDVKLPPPKAMRAHVDRVRAARKECGEEPLFVRDRLRYMDSIAEYIGAKPKLWTSAKCRLALLPTLLLGPAEAWHYRLDGPYSFNQLSCTTCSQDGFAQPGDKPPASGLALDHFNPSATASSSSTNLASPPMPPSHPEEPSVPQRVYSASNNAQNASRPRAPSQSVHFEGLPDPHSLSVLASGEAASATTPQHLQQNSNNGVGGPQTPRPDSGESNDSQDSNNNNYSLSSSNPLGSQVSLDQYDGHSHDMEITARRKRTLPGCDHLHHLDDRNRQVLFFMARTDYYNELVRRMAKKGAYAMVGVFLLHRYRHRLFAVAKAAIRFYFVDFLEIGR